MKEKVWSEALDALREAFRQDKRSKQIFSHLVAFFRVLKEAGWEKDEIKKDSRKRKEVFDIFYVNWIGGTTSNKSKRYFQIIERDWMFAIAHVWKTIELSYEDVSNVKHSADTPEASEAEDGEFDFAEDFERMAAEGRRADQERFEYLLSLEASGIITEEQRRWLAELRNRFEKK